MLNQFPCKKVELVGWVAGVEDKESFMNILCKLGWCLASSSWLVDDGDGSTVVAVRCFLPIIPPKPVDKPPIRSSSTYMTKGEREAAKKAEAEAGAAERELPKVYERKDIQVGDVVRVIGRVDEYGRRKETHTEWVRGVTVQEGQGGSIRESPCGSEECG